MRRVDVAERTAGEQTSRLQDAEAELGRPVAEELTELRGLGDGLTAATTAAREAERLLLQAGPGGLGERRVARCLGRRDELPAPNQRRYGELAGAMAVEATITKQPDGTFQAPAGFDGSLAATSSGWTLNRTSQGDQFGFNSSGQLAWTRDSQAHDFTVQGTSAAGRDVLSSYGTSSGRRVNLSYNGDSLVREMDDPSSGHHYYGYTNGKLTSYRSPSGAETTYRYASNGYLDRITEASGTTVELSTTADGKVQLVTTTLPGGVGQTTSFVYTRRPYKTDVTGPDHVRRTYAYDDDYRVTRQYNPDVAPTATASGELREMAGQYVNGNRVYPVTVAATEPDGAGLTRVGVESNGQELVGTEPPCTVTSFDRACPTDFTAALQADLSGLAEGRQTLYGVATDDEQHHERSAGWDVLVDRTPPPAPAGAEALYDSDDQSTGLSWDPANDPTLADGTAGSGTTSYRYRYKVVGGAWSVWTTVLGAGDTVSGLSTGQTLTVETQATDAVGNAGPVSSAAVTVQDATLTPENVGDSLSSEATLDPDSDAIVGEPASWSTADPDDAMENEDTGSSSQAPPLAAQALLSSSDGAFSLNLCNNGSPCGTYNGSAAAAHAHGYYNKRNKNYALYDDDCTNFVSQALHYGDMHFLRTRNGVNDPQGPKHPAGTYVRGSHSWWSQIRSVDTYQNSNSWSVS